MLDDLRERIRQELFLLDGAMGTQLIARGINAGTCNDYLNIESPDIISEIHLAYLKAGSDAVTTNTFGANQYALARHGLAGKVAEINSAAVKIARQAAGDDHYILGDIGPTGDFLEPLGNLKPAECKDAFTRQAEALLAGGVDGFIIETMTALDEITIAIEAIKQGIIFYAIFPENLSVEAERYLKIIEIFIEDYKKRQGTYPEHLLALREFAWTQYGYKISILNPWGQPYRYFLSQDKHKYRLEIGDDNPLGWPKVEKCWPTSPLERKER